MLDGIADGARLDEDGRAVFAGPKVGSSPLMEQVLDVTRVMRFSLVARHGSSERGRLRGLALPILQCIRAPCPAEGVALPAIPVPEEALDALRLLLGRSEVTVFENATL